MRPALLIACLIAACAHVQNPPHNEAFREPKCEPICLYFSPAVKVRDQVLICQLTVDDRSLQCVTPEEFKAMAENYY